MKVAVLGASNKPQRYSYQALMLLKEKGHEVYPLHRRLNEIEGLKVFSSLNDIKEPVDTVTMYVGAAISSTIAEDIINKAPRRIIFNPGAENPQLEIAAREKGILVLNACTLVMLRTGQF